MAGKGGREAEREKVHGDQWQVREGGKDQVTEEREGVGGGGGGGVGGRE